MIIASALLKKKIDKVLNIDRNNTFEMTFVLKSRSNPDFDLDVVIVDQFTITQNFNDDITDSISLNINVPPADMILINDNQADLYCTIKIEYFNLELRQVDFEEDVEIYTFNVFVKNMQDIAKRYSLGAFLEEDFETTRTQEKSDMNIPVELQLISEEGYSFKKKSVVGMFTLCTVESLLKYISSVMGISRINMVPPDNTTEYKNLYIPPEFGKIDVIFDYIQKRYGVYSHGLGYYFTNGVLYIYPLYETDTERDPMITLVRTNPNSYIGSTNYHDEKDDEITIVTTGDILQKSLHNVTSENEGNSSVLLLADKIIDKSVSIKGDDITLEDIAVILNNNNDLTITEGSAIPVYQAPAMNIYKILSNIHNSATEAMIVGWSMARIFRLTPGQKVRVLYDKDGAVEIVLGILTAASFVCDPSKETSWSGSLVVRLSPFTKKI